MCFTEKLNNFFKKTTSITEKNNHTKIKQKNEKTGIRRDLGTIVFLIFCYFLQMIPLGLNRSISLILGSRNATYGAQGTFSFVSWPYSLKIIWAPIVDTLYIKRFGRRRSWIIPLNLLITVFMFSFGNLSNRLLYHSESQTGMNYYITWKIGLITD